MTEETIFATALEKPADARAAYLAEACGHDEALRKRLEALVAASAKVGNFMANPAVAPAVDPVVTQAVPATAGRGAPATDSAEEPLTFLTPSARPDSLGRIGHYEVLQVLGRGGFGIVFRAFDEVLQRVVALKVLAPHMAATSPARQRFMREARSSAKLRHENVVQVYDVQEQPLPYLVMEFIPGETLQQRLDRVGPLDVPETLRIGRQIAEGLAAAHATDLIHRDIKPANMLLEGGHHKVKITDFGLARAADDASLTQSGMVAGTPMYMAPEQAEGQTLDQRADLFSLGSVLYTMVSGRPPFRASTTVAVLKRVADDRPRAIREIIPETPPWLCDIIAKLHAKNPDERYQSAREVADVLTDCEAQLKANSRLRDFSRIPQRKPASSGMGKWVAAAAVLLLPLIALAVTEFAGVTHLFRGQVTSDLNKPGSDLTPVVVANKEPPVPVAKQAPPLAIAPFDAAQARAHQEAWAKYLGVPVESANTIGMKFKLIPAGTFTMGSSPKEIERTLSLLDNSDWAKEQIPTEGPLHGVEITQPFCMGVTHVTVGQFRQFVEEAKYEVGNDRWQKPGFAQFDDCPVVVVTWDNAVAFCAWLSKKEGKTYRLPTEAEWEYSCRAGKDTRYCFGDDDAQLEDYCWYAKNSGGGTKPVGKKKPNDWGLCDMHGNAWEWCQDYWDPNYYKTSPPKDPTGSGAGGARVIRGGTWLFPPALCRSAFRQPAKPHIAFPDQGFRVLLVVPPAGVGTESGTKDEKIAEEKKDPDRRAAKYVLSVGGTVRVDGNDNDIRAPEGKLPTGAFQLTYVYLHGNKQVTDSGLAVFKDCKNLTFLSLHGCAQITDAGLAHFKGCKNLTNLDLEAVPVTAAGLAVFAGNKDLTDLGLGNMGATDAGLVHFKDSRKLKRIGLLNAAAVTDAGLAHLKDCKDLTSLDLRCTGVTDAGLEYFEGCKELVLLSLGATAITDAGLAHFKDCNNLKYVDLCVTKVTDAGLAHLKDCKNLTELWMTRAPITDAGLALLKDHKKLWRLHLDATPVTDAGLLHLAGLQELALLLLDETTVSDAGLAHLHTCKNLTEVYLRKTKVAAKGIDALQKALPQCKITWDGGVIEPTASVDPDRRAAEYVLSTAGGVRINGDTEVRAVVELPQGPFRLTHVNLNGNKRVTDAGLAAFESCTNLTQLSMHDCAQVTDAGFAHFKSCKGLAGIDLWGVSLTDAGLAHLKGNKKLTNLCLVGTQVTDAGLAYLKECTSLAEMYLMGRPVTDAGLACLKDCKNLTWLHLESTKVTDAGLAYLKGKNLTFLALERTEITDAGLAHLKDCKTLTQLWLRGTQVGDVGLAYFKDCKDLNTLNVRETKVSAAGIEALKKALPKCRIEWDGGVIEPTASADPNRRAADYVLSNGGAVKVNGQNKEIRASADLPGDSFRLTGVVLWNADGNQVSVTEAGLAVFKDCKEVTEIKTFRTRLTDAGLAHFKNCKNLTFIGMAAPEAVTDEGLAAFKDCKNLKFLRLTGVPLTGAGLVHFKDCKNLASVHLYGTQVSDAGLIHLKSCKNLTDISLLGAQVSDAGLTHLAGLDALTDLDIRQTRVTVKGAMALAKALPKCKIEWDGGVIEPTASVDPDRRAAEYVLSIGGRVRVDGNDGDIPAKADLPKEALRLTAVELHDNREVTDAGLAAFADCTNVTCLRLSGTQVTGAGLVYLKDCKKLSEVSFLYAPVTDAGLAHLKNCKGLTRLDLRGTKVTDAGLAHFKDCKNLSILWLGGTSITDAGLAVFKDCTDLTHLNLATPSITGAGLAHFTNCKNLKDLDLNGTSIRDESLAHLKGHDKLATLFLHGTPVTDAGLSHLAGLKGLTEIFLNGTKVSDRGLADFKGMPLKKLFIDNTSITDLTPLQGIPLEDIRLTPKNITKGLDILRDMKSLKTIGVDQQAWPAPEFWQRYDMGEFK